jgi:hypothetical protein
VYVSCRGDWGGMKGKSLMNEPRRGGEREKDVLACLLPCLCCAVAVALGGTVVPKSSASLPSLPSSLVLRRRDD